jgi:hypothetical protein
MTITKTALAAAILAALAVSANAQQGPTRQIQVLPAPIQVAKAPSVITEQGPAKLEPETQPGEAPEAAPAPEPAPAASAAPQPAPKVIAAAPGPKFAEPRFAEPKFAPPVRKASYGYGRHGGYAKSNCH